MEASTPENCSELAHELVSRICNKAVPVDRRIINVEHTIDAHYHEHGYPIRMVLWAASETHYPREAPLSLKIDGDLLGRLQLEADSTRWIKRGDVSVYRQFMVVCGRDRLRFMFEVPLTKEWYPEYVRSAWD